LRAKLQRKNETAKFFGEENKAEKILCIFLDIVLEYQKKTITLQANSEILLWTQ
jgi:hypothetical protein